MVLHADLFVKSMDVALSFYRDKLGFQLVDDAIISGPLIQCISSGKHDIARVVLLRLSPVGAMIELQEFQGACADSPNSERDRIGLISILVANLNSYIAGVRVRGLEPASDVFIVKLPRQGCCRVVFYEDADGNRIEFVEVGHAWGERQKV